MHINILEMIDFAKVDHLLEGFSKATGFVTAIVDLDGNVLSQSGWRTICTEFHRINPEASRKCKISDSELASKLAEGEPYHLYTCLNGLVDAAVPIVVKGEHIANLFSGQFLIEKPDISYFKEQAQQYGFDELEYLQALEEVPVVSKEKVASVMEFLLNMTSLISEITLQKYEQLELNEALRKSEERSRGVLDQMLEGCQIIGFDRKYIYLNSAAETHNRRPNSELLGKSYVEAWPGIEQTEMFTIIEEVLNKRVPKRFETEFVFPDGSHGWYDLSIQPVPEGVYLLSIDISERKKKERELYESEFRFNRLWEDGPFGLMMVDKSLHFQAVNPVFCKILGFSETELLKLSFADITHPDDLLTDIPSVQKLISNEIAIYRTEKRYIKKDGQVIWGAITVTANYDANGKFLNTLAVLEDISQRKQVEDELINSRKLLAETESIGRVGGWEVNLDTLLQTWTDEVYRIHEVEFDFNPNVDNGIEFYTPESKPLITNAVQRAFQNGDSFDLDLEIVTAKGNLRNVHTIGRADLENRRVYGFFQDITERKQKEEKLKELEYIMSEGQKIAHMGTFEYVVATQTTHWSEEEYRIYGLDSDKPSPSYEEMLAKCIHPDDAELLNATFAAAVQNLSVYELEHRIVKPDGTIRWVYDRAQPYFDQNGKLVRYVGSTLDITERRQAEEKIHELNERISTATRASQVGIWDWDVKNNVLYWDDQMYVLYGVKKDEFSGAVEAWLNGLHPDDREYCENETRLALLGEKPYDTEFRIVLPDKTVRYCKAKGEVFRNGLGEPERMVGVNYDITARKQIEKELQERGEYLKLGYESAGLGIWKNDLTTMTIEFDERARVHYGFDTSVVNLSDVIARVHPDDVGRLGAEIAKATGPAGEGKYATTYRVIHPDGSIHWLSVSVRVMFEGEGGEDRKSILGFGTSLDITQIKRTVEELEASKVLINTALSSMNDAVLITDIMGKFIDFNEAFASFHKFKNKEECAKKFEEDPAFLDVSMADGKRAGDEQLAVHRALKGEIAKNVEYTLHRKDTGETWVGSYSFAPIRDASGEITGAVVTSRDITEIKLAEENIRRLNAELEERVTERTAQLEYANRELEAFSYSVSHDLRAPLRHINGYVELLNDRFKDNLPEKGLHYLKTITDVSKQMGTLIDDLLQFSRTGRQEMKKIRVDMNQLVAELIANMKQDLENRKVVWSVQEMPMVYGDLTLLKQVWINLLGNAVKYSRFKEQAEITITCKSDTSDFIFCVRDNGVGFDMKYSSKLFGVFQRLHSQSEFEGTGIGLANVQRIISRHNGKVWAEAEPDKGAAFFFSLPKKMED